MRRNAFTFIEVMAVVTLLGLLAGAAAWSLAGETRRANRDRIIELIAQEDRLARLDAANRDAGCTLRFDLAAQSLRRLTQGPGGSVEMSPAVVLPRGGKVDRLMRAASPSRDAIDPNGEGPDPGTPDAFDSGVVDIAVSSAGRSASYALKLAWSGADPAADDDASAGTSTWLVVAGLSGQVTVIHDDKEVEQLFGLLATGQAASPGGADPH